MRANSKENISVIPCSPKLVKDLGVVVVGVVVLVGVVVVVVG